MTNASARVGGEFGLIARFAARVGAPASPAGPGDDAAVIPAPDGRVVATTDLLAEGIHFRLDWSSGADIGHRAAAANLADIVAMGARPTALLVGIALPAAVPDRFLDDLADGLRDECALAGARIVGGDTVASSDRLTLAITALGDLDGREPVTRAGARPGDELVLVGRVGWAAAGLSWLTEHPRAADTGPLAVPERYAPAVAAHRRPEPPYGAGVLLAELGAHALCDVSDGLTADAGHLAEASGVALHLETDGLRDPYLEGLREPGSPPVWELTGGDDHALLAALPAGTRLAALTGARRIGWVRDGMGVYVDGDAVSAASGGYNHFGR